MLVTAIARIDDRAPDRLRYQGRRTAGLVPDDDQIRAHGIDGEHGVDQALALLDARLLDRNAHHLGAEPLPGDFERQQGARAILEEAIDLRQPGEPVVLLAPAAVELDPLLRLVEQEEDILPGEAFDAQQVAVWKGSHRRPALKRA